MSDIIIPPEALEKAARKLAAIKMGLFNDGERLPDDLWMQCMPEARAACLAMLKNWQGSYSLAENDSAVIRDVAVIILPLPQEGA